MEAKPAETVGARLHLCQICTAVYRACRNFAYLSVRAPFEDVALVPVDTAGSDDSGYGGEDEDEDAEGVSVADAELLNYEPHGLYWSSLIDPPCICWRK